MVLRNLRGVEFATTETKSSSRLGRGLNSGPLNYNSNSSINCVSDLPLRTSATHLTVCTVNARSIANKSALFVDYINECNADLCAITETWLSDNDSAVCHAITPPSYKLFHCPRSDRRVGGTALLFRDNINVCKFESGSRNAFEFSEYLVCTGSLCIRLVIIYRPPYSTNHPVTVNSFIDEFSEYLESVLYYLMISSV